MQQPNQSRCHRNLNLPAEALWSTRHPKRSCRASGHGACEVAQPNHHPKGLVVLHEWRPSPTRAANNSARIPRELEPALGSKIVTGLPTARVDGAAGGNH
ncbi:hypothetical protein MJO29_011851 [Puccinia striiformis f. sp. tritici]|nr:hypothetical protein MJO29_011851 [Puccinia striiformis f. sp. tritici]